MIDLKPNYKISRDIAAGGMVLLKNACEILPFSPSDRVGVIGSGALNLIKGGGGSADVMCEYVKTFLDGFSEKKKEGKINYDEASFELARNNECYTVEELNLLSERVDTVVYVYRRFGTEGEDRPLGEYGEKMSGELVNFYPYREELELFENVERSDIKNLVLILNVSSVVDFSFIEKYSKIRAVLLTFLPGMECGSAIADVLVGDVNPSGKLTDTVAYNYTDYPSSPYFNSDPRVSEYKEGLYIGYRHFETKAKEKVMYPFGYGLSYTTFEYSNFDLHVDNENVKLTLTVKNTGKMAGREVVECYVHAPCGNLDKPQIELRGYTKTPSIKPGECERVSVIFKRSDMASFDQTGATGFKGAYVLEAGEYEIYAGKSSRELYLAGVYMLDKTEVAEQLTLRFNGDEYEYNLKFDNVEWTGEQNKSLYDVSDGHQSLFDFVNRLTPEELVSLSLGQPLAFVEGTSGLGNLRQYEVVNPQTADGPAGIRRAVNTTCFPCATLIACSWDCDLQQKMGKALGYEGYNTGIDVILGPAMNIHRNPLCGRCFEYFSEDPLISGKTAAAIVRGIESEGFLATLKHYAVNSCEYNRCVMDSVVDERTLREIYLKGFEIAVKESNPAFIMTSYNLLNGVHTSSHTQLLRGMLRDEWGYEGATMTDWRNGVPLDDEIAAGNNIKMPFGYPDEGMRALKSYKSGKLPLSVLRDNAYYVLSAVMKSRAHKLRDFGVIHKLCGDELYIPAIEVNGLASSRIAHKTREDGLEYLYRLNREQRNQRSFVYYMIDAALGGEFDVMVEFATNCPKTEIWFYCDDATVPVKAYCSYATEEDKWYKTKAKINLKRGMNMLKLVFANEPNRDYEFFNPGGEIPNAWPEMAKEDISFLGMTLKRVN